jgi:hypothetical protein
METTSGLQACENTHPGSTDKLSWCHTKDKQNSAVVRRCGAEDATANKGKPKLSINNLQNPNIVSKPAVTLIHPAEERSGK